MATVEALVAVTACAVSVDATWLMAVVVPAAEVID